MVVLGWLVSIDQICAGGHSDLLVVTILDSQRYSRGSQANLLCLPLVWHKPNHVMSWVSWEHITQPKALGGWGLKNIFLFSKALVAKVGWRLILTTSLWMSVIYQKYIAPLSMIDWIRLDHKRCSGVSIIWKAIVRAFDLVGDNLAWSVGNGHKFLIGRVVWAGGDQVLLSEELCIALSHRRFTFLHQVANPLATTFWNQGWLEGDQLGLLGHLLIEWDTCLRAIRLCHIRLTQREDRLVWDSHPNGVYTPKAGYIKLATDHGQGIQLWWWHNIWKLKCPSKSKLFLWSVLTNTVLTWDYLQRRCFDGPGWCPLSKSALETPTHIFIDCPFSKSTWMEAHKGGMFNSNWCGTQPEATLRAWTNNRETQSIRALPCIIRWGIWLAHNKVIFQNI